MGEHFVSWLPCTVIVENYFSTMTGAKSVGRYHLSEEYVASCLHRKGNAGAVFGLQEVSALLKEEMIQVVVLRLYLMIRYPYQGTEGR